MNKITKNELALLLKLSANASEKDLEYYIFNDKNVLVGIKDSAPEHLKKGVKEFLN